MIRGWDIERFGSLHKYQVRNLPPGLVLFFGPNGSARAHSGRFCLACSLVRRSLPSGLPSDRYDRSDGGRVVCAGPNGEAVLERRAWNRFALHLNGEAGTQRELEELCGLPDLSSYRSIFVIEPGELNSFEPLAGTGLAARLFTAAGTEGEQLERRARRRLWRHAAKTLRSEGGRSIGDALDELEALGKRLEETRQASNAHGELERQLRSFEHRLPTCRAVWRAYVRNRRPTRRCSSCGPRGAKDLSCRRSSTRFPCRPDSPRCCRAVPPVRNDISDAQHKLNETLAQEAALGRQLDESRPIGPLEVPGEVEALFRKFLSSRLLRTCKQVDGKSQTRRGPGRALRELPNVRRRRSIRRT